jgi:ketosteroid isomerase-like protein
VTERHREFAETAYVALNRRDLTAFLEKIDRDVEFRSLIAEAEGESFHGHDGVRRWWAQVAQSLGGLGFELEDYEEEGDGAVTRIRVRGSVEATGIEQTMWQAIQLRDEKVVWWGTFRTGDEAWVALRERLGR